MKLIRKGAHEKEKASFPVVATIGNFDGLHLGHQSIIEQLKVLAKERQCPSMVITFEPTPSEFFLGDKAPVRLLEFQQKFEILQSLGVDIMCVLHFNLEMSHLTAKAFVEKMLLEELGIVHLIVGDDFRFGFKREGNVDFLKSYEQEKSIRVTIARTVEEENERISSTRIRALIAAGNIQAAEHLLGRKVNK